MSYHKNATAPVVEEEFAHIHGLEKCVFCAPPDKKVLMETANFYVSYDAYPLTDGHVLIHTKNHIGCAGEISPGGIEEYIELKNRIAQLIKDIYGMVSFFEHGRAGSCHIVNDDINCHHFHIHALPMNVDIAREITQDANVYTPIKMRSNKEIVDLYQHYDQYLYFENAQADKYFFPVAGSIPSHYLRMVSAHALNRSDRAEWDNRFDIASINRFKQKIQEKM